MSKIAEHDPQKVSLERPLLHIFWKRVNHKNGNERLGKVTKFQVFITNNECAVNRKPRGGPIRPPPDRNRVKLNTSIIGCYIAKKNVSADDVIFPNSDFEHSRRCTGKMTFLCSWGQTYPKTHNFYSKISILKFYFCDPRVTWPWFAWGQIAK